MSEDSSIKSPQKQNPSKESNSYRKFKTHVNKSNAIKFEKMKSKKYVDEDKESLNQSASILSHIGMIKRATFNEKDSPVSPLKKMRDQEKQENSESISGSMMNPQKMKKMFSDEPKKQFKSSFMKNQQNMKANLTIRDQMLQIGSPSQYTQNFTANQSAEETIENVDISRQLMMIFERMNTMMNRQESMHKSVEEVKRDHTKLIEKIDRIESQLKDSKSE